MLPVPEFGIEISVPHAEPKDHEVGAKPDQTPAWMATEFWQSRRGPEATFVFYGPWPEAHHDDHLLKAA